jgi:hypothetical protein
VALSEIHPACRATLDRCDYLFAAENVDLMKNGAVSPQQVIAVLHEAFDILPDERYWSDILDFANTAALRSLGEVLVVGNSPSNYTSMPWKVVRDWIADYGRERGWTLHETD